VVPALVAGVLGGLVTLVVVLAGLALTDGGDLRAVLSRRPGGPAEPASVPTAPGGGGSSA